MGEMEQYRAIVAEVIEAALDRERGVTTRSSRPASNEPRLAAPGGAVDAGPRIRPHR